MPHTPSFTLSAMTLSQVLRSATGVYYGTGDGPESGPFVARISIGILPNGGVSIDYEASSREQGLQHREHSLLVAGPDGRDQIYIAHSESPFITVMSATEPGSSRFTQTDTGGPYEMEVVIETPEPGRITYAWWWAHAGQTPIEQSKADAKLVEP